MGTPHFAVPTLQRLANSRHRVLAVVTNPGRPQGRGRQPKEPPVKQAALNLGLKVLQPDSLLNQHLADELSGHSPDLFVVVAFSILPAALLHVPGRGSLNLHPSLLPAYRGAAPIIWAVVNGETETGLTTFMLDEKVDTGGILLQQRVPIGVDETAGELEERLAEQGAECMLSTIEKLEEGLEPTPQEAIPHTNESGKLPRARKLKREDGNISWERNSEEVRNHVRGMNPVPGAYTQWKKGTLKIHRAVKSNTDRSERPGTILSADPRKGLVVATGIGAVELTQVQPEGKSKMEGTAFVRGYAITAGEQFGPG